MLENTSTGQKFQKGDEVIHYRLGPGVVRSVGAAEDISVDFASGHSLWCKTAGLTKNPNKFKQGDAGELISFDEVWSRSRLFGGWLNAELILAQIPQGGKTMHHETFTYPNFTNMDVKDCKLPFHLVFCPDCKNVTLVVEEKLAKEVAARLTEKTGNLHVVLKATEFCAPVANVNWTKM